MSKIKLELTNESSYSVAELLHIKIIEVKLLITSYRNKLMVFKFLLAPAKGSKKAATPRKAASSGNSSGKTAKKTPEQKKVVTDDSEEGKEKDKEAKSKVPSKDDSFREFRRVCSNVADVDAYTDKTAIIKRMFTRGSLGGKYLYFSFSLD